MEKSVGPKHEAFLDHPSNCLASFVGTTPWVSPLRVDFTSFVAIHSASSIVSAKSAVLPLASVADR